MSFNLSGTLTIAPSHDSVNTSRVLAVTASSATLKIARVSGFIPNLAAGAFAEKLAEGVEEGLNAAISDGVFTGLGAQGEALSPGSIISAQRVVVAPAGMLIALVLEIFTDRYSKRTPSISV